MLIKGVWLGIVSIMYRYMSIFAVYQIDIESIKNFKYRPSLLYRVTHQAYYIATSLKRLVGFKTRPPGDEHSDQMMFGTYPTERFMGLLRDDCTGHDA